MMKNDSTALTLSLLVPLLLAGCGSGKPTLTPAKAAAARWKKAVAEYPVPLIHQGPLAARPFDFSRDRILEMMVKKLDGATSKASFDHIRTAFGRLPKQDAVRVLNQFIEGLLGQASHTRPILQNACEAAGAVADPGLVEVLTKAALVKDEKGSRYFHASVQKEALQAIGKCASMEQCEDLWEWFFGRGDRKELGAYGKIYLVRALVGIQGEQALPRLRQVLELPRLQADLQRETLQQTLELPAAKVAPILIPVFSLLKGADRLTAAAILHRAGFQQGTAYLQKALKEAKEPRSRANLVKDLGSGPDPRWVEEVLPFSTDPSPMVSLALIEAIAKAPGQAVEDTLLFLSRKTNESVRIAALKALLERGNLTALNHSLETFGKATGSAARQAMNELVQAGDRRLVPLVLKRLPKAAGVEKFNLMQVFTRLADPRAIPVLLEIMKEPPVELARRTDNIHYASIVISNIPQALPRLVEAANKDFASDTVRRYHCYSAIARILSMEGVAKESVARTLDQVMAWVADEKGDPRDRIALPRLFIGYLGLDEVMKLKRIAAATADTKVRAGLTLLLWEFFGRPER